MDRFESVKFDELNAQVFDELRKQYSILSKSIECLGQRTYQEMAQTKLEESFMWVGKALRDIQLHRNELSLKMTIPGEANVQD